MLTTATKPMARGSSGGCESAWQGERDTEPAPSESKEQRLFISTSFDDSEEQQSDSTTTSPTQGERPITPTTTFADDCSDETLVAEAESGIEAAMMAKLRDFMSSFRSESPGFARDTVTSMNDSPKPAAQTSPTDNAFRATPFLASLSSSFDVPNLDGSKSTQVNTEKAAWSGVSQQSDPSGAEKEPHYPPPPQVWHVDVASRIMPAGSPRLTPAMSPPPAIPLPATPAPSPTSAATPSMTLSPAQERTAIAAASATSPEAYSVSPKQPRTLRVLAMLRHWEAGRMARWWAWRDQVLLAAIKEEEVRRETRRRFLTRLRTHPWVEHEASPQQVAESAAAEDKPIPSPTASPVLSFARKPSVTLAVPMAMVAAADADSSSSTSSPAPASPALSAVSAMSRRSSDADVGSTKEVVSAPPTPDAARTVRAMAVERLRAARGGRERDRSAQVLLRVGGDHRSPPADEVQPFERHRTALVGQHAGALPVVARPGCRGRPSASTRVRCESGWCEATGEIRCEGLSDRELAARKKLCESRQRVRTEIDILVQRANLRLEALQADTSPLRSMSSKPVEGPHTRERPASPPRRRLSPDPAPGRSPSAAAAGKHVCHPLAVSFDAEDAERPDTAEPKTLLVTARAGPGAGSTRNKRRSSSVPSVRNMGEGPSTHDDDEEDDQMDHGCSSARSGVAVVAKPRSASVDRRAGKGAANAGSTGAGAPGGFSGAGAPMEALLSLRRRMLAQQKALNAHPPEDAVTVAVPVSSASAPTSPVGNQASDCLKQSAGALGTNEASAPTSCDEDSTNGKHSYGLQAPGSTGSNGGGGALRILKRGMSLDSGITTVSVSSESSAISTDGDSKTPSSTVSILLQGVARRRRGSLDGPTLRSGEAHPLLRTGSDPVILGSDSAVSGSDCAPRSGGGALWTPASMHGRVAYHRHGAPPAVGSLSLPQQVRAKVERVVARGASEAGEPSPATAEMGRKTGLGATMAAAPAATA
ncbi:hypothetical protein HDU96_008212 [Phlyctochytrium bullatum]|nr:hypothetical protein HDU96_008212 [Phlyctochytrium bullatum]